jgi:hypothetical protein
VYFAELESALASDAPTVDSGAVEQEWRALFDWAWVDFHRFLLGWAPSYADGDDYSEELVRAVLTRG